MFSVYCILTISLTLKYFFFIQHAASAVEGLGPGLELGRSLCCPRHTRHTRHTAYTALTSALTFKDLSVIGRPPERCVILDNSPIAYMFQVEQAIPCVSWYDDPEDRELFNLIPILYELATYENAIDGLRNILAKLPPEYGQDTRKASSPCR